MNTAWPRGRTPANPPTNTRVFTDLPGTDASATLGSAGDTNQDDVTVELENCYILLFEEKITSNKKLIPLLEAISKAKKPLLVIAEDTEGEEGDSRPRALER